MADQCVLECQGLRRCFGKLVAVDGVGFHIDPGETYGLLGPNGAGKTTSISMIAGLLERDAGEVTVAGEPMTTHSVRAKAARPASPPGSRPTSPHRCRSSATSTLPSRRR